MRRLLILLVLAGCWGSDADGDGFAGATDCDDADAAVFPGAREVCNGIDDDCDGEIDGAYAVGATEHYVDADGDGFGVGEPELRCAGAEGWAVEDGDCDDTTNLRAPRNGELCNGVDDDCNGLIDDEPLNRKRVYPDLDGDGQGERGSVELWCTPPQGFVEDGRDCNDDNPAQYTGAPEICFDGIANDCDHDADPLAVCSSRAWDEASPWARLTDTARGLGSVLVPAGDLDGDGFDDLVLGTRQPPSGEGEVRVWYGPVPSGETSAEDLAALRGAGVGERLAGVGDMDGDGADDLMLVTSEAKAQVVLVYGGERWSGTRAIDGPAWGHPRDLGYGVVAAGEITSDLFDDALINEAEGYGSVYLVPGSGSRYVGDGRLTGLTRWEGTASRPGLEAVDRGDVSGDGLDELVFRGDGAIYLRRGSRVPPSGVLSADALDAILGEPGLGEVMDVEDVDRDGYWDVLASDGSGVQLFLGGADGLSGTRSVSDADLTLSAPDGQLVTGLGLNLADGLHESLIIASGAEGESSVSIHLTEPVIGEEPFTRVDLGGGAPRVWADDQDGDGYHELIIADGLGAGGEGSVLLFRGMAL